MALTAQEIAKLRRIVSIAETLIAQHKRGRPSRKRMVKARVVGKRIRRMGKELVAFRRMIKAERKKGVSAAALARKHGVTTAYVYMIR